MAFIYAGNYLLSHTLSRAVQSAQRGLTSVFGMGTGGPPRYDHRLREWKEFAGLHASGREETKVPT